MSTELLLAFIAFAFVTSVTPGPNNMMLLASGVNFGVRRSIPHMLGISLGFMLLVAAVGLGLGQVFQRLPVLHDVLRYVGAAYLLYLAWKTYVYYKTKSLILSSQRYRRGRRSRL